MSHGGLFEFRQTGRCGFRRFSASKVYVLYTRTKMPPSPHKTFHELLHMLSAPFSVAIRFAFPLEHSVSYWKCQTSCVVPTATFRHFRGYSDNYVRKGCVVTISSSLASWQVRNHTIVNLLRSDHSCPSSYNHTLILFSGGTYTY